MKIALTYHQTFARVRRGTERLMEETAAYLAGRGHQATVIACGPGPHEESWNRGFRTVRHRRPWHPALAVAGIHEYHTFPLTVLGHLLRERFDLVYTFSFFDACAALEARRMTGTPVVLVVNNLPARDRRVRTASLGGALCRRAVRGADAVVAISGFMRRCIEERWGTGSEILPPPVDLDQFPLHAERDHARPVVLSTATLDEPRKGGPLLMRAFNLVKGRRPGTVLEVASAIPGPARQELLALVEPRWRGDVRFPGQGRAEELHRVYGRAAVSVLPSRREPFGMVVVESLATGTPVVGTREGALPELIDGDGVGRLFDPGDPDTPGPTNVEGLAGALVEALDLSRLPETPGRCRARAEPFGWPAVGPRIEELCGRVAAASVPQ